MARILDRLSSASRIALPNFLREACARKIGLRSRGYATLTLAMSNGIITNFGQTTDIKAPESLTSLAGLETALGANAKAMAEAAKTRSEIKLEAGEISAQAVIIRSVADDLRSLSKATTFTTADQTTLKLAAGALDTPARDGAGATGLAAALDAPGAEAKAEALAKNLADATKGVNGLKAPESLSEDEQKDWNKLGALKAQIQGVLKALKPAEAAVVQPPALPPYVQLGPDRVSTDVRLVGKVVREFGPPPWFSRDDAAHQGTVTALARRRADGAALGLTCAHCLVGQDGDPASAAPISLHDPALQAWLPVGRSGAFADTSGLGQTGGPVLVGRRPVPKPARRRAAV